jgi:hypothetical protein
MKIYLIRHTEFDYDAYMAHVIVANNENEVIELAKKGSADEGKDIWDKATITEEGDYSGTKTEPFKLLSDFRAG